MLLALLLSLSLAAPAVTGVVRDSSGGAIPGASVTIQTPSGAEQQQTVTGPDGRFTFEAAPPAASVLLVRAGGFGEKRMPLAQTAEIEVVLTPAALLETVVVTPTRSEQRLGDLPASVSVLSSERIEMSPALTSDDVLRQIPSFSLFRRANAIAAQPTTQGVSLRGIGPSGQSRTLVLLDGVPFNDPFGGWVYWTRVPLESVDRIEVTEDSASSLYGNYAMGGVINIVTARPTRRMVELKPQYGNKNSPKFDFLATDRWNDLGVAVDGSFFNTDGYPIVTTEAGPIDNNANVEYRNIATRLEYVPNDHFSGFFRAGYFTEDRNNAKVGELNDTRWTTISGGARAGCPTAVTCRGVFGDIQHAHFNFLAVTNPATTATCALRDRPTRADQQRGGHGAVDQDLRHEARLHRGDRLPVGRWRQRGGRLRPCRAHGHRRRDAAGDVVGSARLRGIAAERRRVPSGRLHADAQADGDA